MTRALLFVLAWLILPVPAVLAQTQQVVAGTVVDASSLRPVQAAQVRVEGTELAVLTDADGRFRLAGVEGTSVTLVVERIGYQAQRVTARVGAMDLRVSLGASAVQLDEVVVTGTAGDMRMRGIGNAVARLDVEDRVDVAPVSDLNGLLVNETPGVVINPGGGDVGSGGNLRIRGVSSISLDNGPLIYVDGVRVQGGSSGFFYVGGLWNVNRLNDIDPTQIERIEILRGPAAATLYGTEASSGVVNIITKRGAPGETRINVSMEQGVNFLHDPKRYFPSAYYLGEDGSLESFHFIESEAAAGRPFFRTGHRQRYGADVSGGTDLVRYFVSGGYEQDEGPFRSNDLDRLTTRTNLDLRVRDNLRLGAGAGYVKSRIHPGSNANGSPLGCAWYPDPSLMETDRRGCTGGPPEAYYEAYQRTQHLNRFTGDVNLTYEPTSWLTTRAVVGLDFVDQENVGLVERLDDDIAGYFGAAALGLKNVQRTRNLNQTMDVSGTARFAPLADLSSTTSMGLQVYQDRAEILGAQAEQFPILGIQSTSSAAITTATEQYVENATVGTYVEQQLGWKDRLFVTGALRADDHSSFGEDFDLVIYPKVSAAWVVSEEPFWGLDPVSTLRLRAAYGQAGRQPDAFSALRTFEPFIGRGDVATVRPQFAGNPELGPERGEEIELGFEASLLEDRIGVDFTYYSKTVHDAILLRNTAPSEGFPQTQYANLGVVSNWGTELSLRTVPMDRPGLRWDLTVNVATNEDRIDDLGDVELILFNLRHQFRVGYPVGGWFEKRVVSWDLTPGGDIANVMCDGGPDSGGAAVPCAQAPRVYLGDDAPNLTGSVNSTLTLFGRLKLFALVDFKRDFQIFSFSRLNACHFLRRCEANFDASADPLLAAEVSQGIWGRSVLLDGSFVKLRQVSASWRLPEQIAAVGGASSASLTVSARNVAIWSDWPYHDPEIQDITPLSTLNLQQGDLPHPMQLLTSIKFSF